MYKILDADKLSENIYRMVVDAPMVARHCEHRRVRRGKEYLLRFVIMTVKKELLRLYFSRLAFPPLKWQSSRRVILLRILSARWEDLRI